MHLIYEGFEFSILRDGYGVDVPHPLSPFYIEYAEMMKKSIKPANQELFELFVDELKTKGLVPLMKECN